MKPNVIIIGAGPVGLTAALELARLGASPRIVDKRASGSGLSRAVGIIPNTMHLLEPSGVAARIEAEAIKIRAAHFFENGEEKAAFRFPISQGTYQHFYALPQDRTEALLRDALKAHGIEVEFGQEFEALSQGEDFVEARINGEMRKADYLIGADGIHSPVRQALGIPYPGYEVDEEWTIIDGIAPNWPYQKEATVWLGEGRGACITIPIGEHRYRIVGAGLDPVRAFQIPIEFEEIYREGQFVISVRQAESYSKGRVFLAGDAAHCHSPVGGRGMNLGMDDAAELARRLVEGDLSDYSEKRHARGARVIKETERARKMVTGDHPRIRQFGLGLLARAPQSVKSKLARNFALRL